MERRIFASRDRIFGKAVHCCLFLVVSCSTTQNQDKMGGPAADTGESASDSTTTDTQTESDTGSETSVERVVLASTATFWVATDGDDSSGDGSYTNPWQTRGRAYSVLSSSYDLNCHTVYIRSKAGTYTDSLQVYDDRLFGQCAPSSVIFSNETDTECGDVVIQPAAQAGYAFSAAYGASYQIQCMKLDMTSQRDAAVDHIITTGADTVSSGQGSNIFFGDGLTFGCNYNGYNHVSVSFGGYAQFDGDLEIDVGLCQVATTGSTAASSNLVTSLASTTDLVVGQGIIAEGLPLDARIGSISGSTITIACATTPECVANATAEDVALTFTGGGQAFLNPGNSSTVYFNTNGQPDYSVIVTLGNYPHFIAGFMYVNGGSTVNAEAITFVNPDQARGRCSEMRALSHIGTGRQGVPYIPCFGGGYDGFTTTANTTAGSKTISVASTTNMAIGQVINGIANPTGTWSAGSDTLTLSSTTGACVGAHITGHGILGGAVINGISGSNVTLNPCGVGPRCVSGYPTYQAGSDTALTITGCGVPNNAIIEEIVDTEVTLSIPAETTTTAQFVVFQSYTSGNSIYD